MARCLHGLIRGRRYRYDIRISDCAGTARGNFPAFRAFSFSSTLPDYSALSQLDWSNESTLFGTRIFVYGLTTEVIRPHRKYDQTELLRLSLQSWRVEYVVQSGTGWAMVKY